MDITEQWGICIGHAQQVVRTRLCSSDPCSLCWPSLSDFGTKCDMPSNFVYENIALKDITIVNPTNRNGAGVILGNVTSTMKNLVFDNVQILSDIISISHVYRCT